MALGPPPLHTPIESPQWKRYFERLSNQLGGAQEGQLGYFNGLNFTNSNITSIATRTHNSLQTHQGGSSGERYHLTAAQHTGVTAGGNFTKSVTDSITAGATQTQAGATALTKDINRVTTVGTDNDGVKLPTASAGLEILIINADAGQDIQIWPNTGDAINGGSANAVDGTPLGEGATRRYIAADATNWYTI
jgi:hypothetical protein|tara:strand:+ start:1726 stop:2301 length:576 start_codon:yes stop_codon:yes gene_type:complete